MKKQAYLVIFQTMIGGRTAQTEIATIKDPLNSRQTRRDCEFAARRAFQELAAGEGQPFGPDEKIKCVDIVEFNEPEPEPGAAN